MCVSVLPCRLEPLWMTAIQRPSIWCPERPLAANRMLGAHLGHLREKHGPVAIFITRTSDSGTGKHIQGLCSTRWTKRFSGSHPVPKKAKDPAQEQIRHSVGKEAVPPLWGHNKQQRKGHNKPHQTICKSLHILHQKYKTQTKTTLDGHSLFYIGDKMLCFKFWALCIVLFDFFWFVAILCWFRDNLWNV